MGAMKSHLRLRAVTTIIRAEQARSIGSTVAHMTLWPVASALYLYNTVAAGLSRRITWRGISYELKSATETIIVSRIVENIAEKTRR
jgi:hypothetical protein